MDDLFNPIYQNERAARKHLEALRWPNGPVCPHCGTVDEATKLKGKSTRPGVWKCRACQKPDGTSSIQSPKIASGRIDLMPESCSRSKS